MKKLHLHNSLTQIAEQIHCPRFHAHTQSIREWGGADVIITSQPIVNRRTSKTIITTRHAKAISWLFQKIRDYTILAEFI